jgi:hypothetical protein
MRMAVPQRRVAVGMRVRLGPFVALMDVLVMLIVHMAMVMLHRFMPVLVEMLLAQGEPGSHGRQA